jgi:dihydroflavonol-4-reductase
VRALVEPGANPKNLDALSATANPRNLERVTVDVCDHRGMIGALQGAASYFHLAAIYRVWTPDPAPTYRVNIEGTTSSLLAAREARVGRVVYTSSIAAVGLRPGDEPSDESTEFNLYSIANPYILTKHLSERIALRFAEAGHPIVVVNPAFPFGAGDIVPTPTGRIVLGLLRGQMPGVGEGGFCAVDVDDVAAGHVAAETKGRVGERYILGNHNVTFREFFSLVCSVAGLEAPRLPIPRLLGRAIGAGMELWADHVSHREPQATYKGIRYLEEKAYFDASKARRELDLPCTPLEVSIRKAVDYFRSEGRVRS